MGMGTMSIFEEMKRDLVDPIKSFTEEVCDDTIGDAKRFYAAKAKTARENARLAEKRTKEKMAAIGREEAEMKKRRKAIASRAVTILAVLALLGIVILSLILNHGL